MTPGDVLTKSKVLRKRPPSLRNRYKLELIWEWKSNISLKANKQKLYLHNANELILFDTFHDVWVHMFAIVMHLSMLSRRRGGGGGGQGMGWGFNGLCCPWGRAFN